MKIIKIIVLIMALGTINSCATKKVVDIKSPCVSNEGGPCGPKKSINNWWINSKIQS